MTRSSHNNHAVPDWQAQRLAAWLGEWEIHCRLAPNRGGPEHAGPAPGLPDADIAPIDPSPQPGEIRLLSPAVPSARKRLIHLALLRAEDDSRLLAVPYSRFSEPALPGELLTGRRDPLCVLCPWNARRVPVGIIEKSWIVDTLSETERDQALAVLRHVRDRVPLPGELIESVGPPMSHPEDPRHAYVNREALFMDRIAATGTLFYPLPEATDLPKAAEPTEPYGREAGDSGPEAGPHA